VYDNIIKSVFYCIWSLYTTWDTISSTYFFVSMPIMKKQCILCPINDCSLADEQSVNNCPINKFLKVLWGKWGMIVLLMLETPQRFWMLKKTMTDISEKMLITTLHELENAWYITKEKITGKRLQSTYTITPSWQKALRIAHAMADMGKCL